MIETIQRGRALDVKDRAQIADLIIDSFGQKLPEPVKKKISAQFRTISKENLQSFCEHGLNVLSVQKFSDYIDLKKVTVETVLIRGEEDTIVDLEDVMFVSSQIPNCQLRVIKNVGHFLHMESEEVFDVYRELLSNTVSTIDDYVACES
jgi:pimeloyl-ACP methyl ester carboxylesterase